MGCLAAFNLGFMYLGMESALQRNSNKRELLMQYMLAMALWRLLQTTWTLGAQFSVQGQLVLVDIETALGMVSLVALGNTQCGVQVIHWAGE